MKIKIKINNLKIRTKRTGEKNKEGIDKKWSREEIYYTIEKIKVNAMEFYDNTWFVHTLIISLTSLWIDICKKFKLFSLIVFHKEESKMKMGMEGEERREKTKFKMRDNLWFHLLILIIRIKEIKVNLARVYCNH